MKLILQSAVPIIAFVALAWLVNENRRQIRWRTVVVAGVLPF